MATFQAGLDTSKNLTEATELGLKDFHVEPLKKTLQPGTRLPIQDLSFNMECLAVLVEKHDLSCLVKLSYTASCKYGAAKKDTKQPQL